MNSSSNSLDDSYDSDVEQLSQNVKRTNNSGSYINDNGLLQDAKLTFDTVLTDLEDIHNKASLYDFDCNFEIPGEERVADEPAHMDAEDAEIKPARPSWFTSKTVEYNERVAIHLIPIGQIAENYVNDDGNSDGELDINEHLAESNGKVKGIVENVHCNTDTHECPERISKDVDTCEERIGSIKLNEDSQAIMNIKGKATKTQYTHVTTKVSKPEPTTENPKSITVPKDIKTIAKFAVPATKKKIIGTNKENASNEKYKNLPVVVKSNTFPKGQLLKETNKKTVSTFAKYATIGGEKRALTVPQSPALHTKKRAEMRMNHNLATEAAPVMSASNKNVATSKCKLWRL